MNEKRRDDMNERISNYLDGVFLPYDGIKSADELKADLLTDLQERFRELKAEGKDDETAFEMTIDSIGDIEQTVQEVANLSRSLKRGVLIYNKRLASWILGTALICMIASLVLPAWSMAQSPLRFLGPINIAPWGAYGGGITVFVTNWSLGPQFAIITLLIMTVISIILLTLELLRVRKDDGKVKHHRVSNILMVSGIFTLITPATFSFLLPQSALLRSFGVDGFWGSLTSIDGTYGPNIGWFLQIIAFVLVAFLIIILASNKKINSKVIPPV
jgi:hypothetical protein